MHQGLATATSRCPYCDQTLAEAHAAFCSKCGRSLSLSKVSRTERKTALTLLALLLLGCTIGVYYLYIQPASLEREAERKTAAAISACHTGNSVEFARRIVDAEMAIRELSFERRAEVNAKFSNQLILAGCPR